MSDESAASGQISKTWLDKLADAFAGEPKNREEITELLRDAEQRQLLDTESLSIIEGAMQVSDMHVREVMIPRSQMVVVHASQKPDEFLSHVIESAHSRFPVIGGESRDEVIGILLAKDLLPLALHKENLDKFCLKSVMRPATFVPESKRLNVLLQEFRVNRNHMAIVIDEYGDAAGLVTIEDVLEQIVGEIEDEHDAEEDDSLIKPIGNEENNVFIVKALTPIEDFNEFFSTQHSDEEFDTIGGIVMHGFGRLPRRDESTCIGNHDFKVLNADNRRIRLLQVSPANQND